jgi:serine/threonine protein kinase
VQGEIGHGGMGAVYRAVRADDQYEKQVAIKVVRRSFDPELVIRFRTERQILAGLDHPFIARLLDGGTTSDGLPYLVMDYVEGEPLIDFAENGKLSVRERLTSSARSAAVYYAHQKLVVHRDLKPSNILVTARARPVFDFGIAKLLSPIRSSSRPPPPCSGP